MEVKIFENVDKVVFGEFCESVTTALHFKDGTLKIFKAKTFYDSVELEECEIREFEDSELLELQVISKEEYDRRKRHEKILRDARLADEARALEQEEKETYQRLKAKYEGE